MTSASGSFAAAAATSPAMKPTTTNSPTADSPSLWLAEDGYCVTQNSGRKQFEHTTSKMSFGQKLSENANNTWEESTAHVSYHHLKGLHYSIQRLNTERLLWPPQESARTTHQRTFPIIITLAHEEIKMSIYLHTVIHADGVNGLQLWCRQRGAKCDNSMLQYTLRSNSEQ